MGEMKHRNMMNIGTHFLNIFLFSRVWMGILGKTIQDSYLKKYHLNENDPILYDVKKLINPVLLSLCKILFTIWDELHLHTFLGVLEYPAECLVFINDHGIWAVSSFVEPAYLPAKMCPSCSNWHKYPRYKAWYTLQFIPLQQTTYLCQSQGRSFQTTLFAYLLNG